MENTLNDLRIEMGRLKGVTENLKQEARKSQVDRNACKHLLFDLKTIFMSVRQHFSDLLKFSMQQEAQPHQMNILSLVVVIGQAFQQQEIEKALDGLGNKISSLATYELDNRQYYDDTKIKNTIYDLTGQFELLVNIFDSKIFRPVGQPIGAIPKIAEFVSRKQFGLDDKWALAACYLSAIDIVVNKRRLELGLVRDEEKDRSVSFNDRFDELVKVIESKQGELNKVLKQLPKPFWKIRTDVIHYGYSPTQDELDLIVSWSQKVIDSLREVQSVQS